MKTTINKIIVNISNDLFDKSKELTTTQEMIKDLNNQKKVIVKDLLNLVLKDLKELNTNNNLESYNKKAKLSIIEDKYNSIIENKYTIQIIKSVIVYLNSKSSLDFNSISNAKFIEGMKLINRGKYTKFKSNNELKKVLKEEEIIKLRNRVNNLKTKA